MSMRLAIALVATLFSCTGRTAAQPENSLTIVPVYEGMARYADAVTANPAADRQALWKQHVLDPYWRPCGEGGEMIEFAPPLATAFADVSALRRSTAAIRAGGVETVIRATMARAAALLPTQSTTICVLAADSGWSYLRDMHGVAGFTAGSGRFWITILPEGAWQDWIANGVAHEYHHSVWMSRHLARDPITDMGDYLVLEGRADSFARLLDPSRRPPWTQALTAPQEARAWATMRRHLRTESAQLMQGLMFGGAEGLPRWSGYTIGFNLVQAYLRAHPAMSVEEWTALEAAELLRQSPYDP